MVTFPAPVEARRLRLWPLPFRMRSLFLVVSGTANILFATWMLIFNAAGHGANLGTVMVALYWSQFEAILLGIALLYLIVSLFRRRPEPGILVDWIAPPGLALVVVAFLNNFIR